MVNDRSNGDSGMRPAILRDQPTVSTSLSWWRDFRVSLTSRDCLRCRRRPAISRAVRDRASARVACNDSASWIDTAGLVTGRSGPAVATAPAGLAGRRVPPSAGGAGSRPFLDPRAPIALLGVSAPAGPRRSPPVAAADAGQDQVV